MEVSSAFKNDIQGQNTQLFPLVVIEYWYRATALEEAIDMVSDLINWFGGDVDFGDEDRAAHIFLSTNNVTVDGDYYNPLLLNIPSIKESMDVESKQFKISNVSLDISNIEYEGKRFSDILSITSLLNTAVSIYIKSPTTTTVTTSWAGYPNTENGCPRIYTGIIRRISHDDTKVRIELEDLTEEKAHKDLPQEYLGDGEGIPDKYKNQPIPICYGHVNRSPLVIGENYRKFIIDNKGIDGTEPSSTEFGDIESPLYIHAEDNYLSVESTSPEGAMAGMPQYEFPIISNYFTLNPSNKDIFPEDDTEPKMYVLDSSRNFTLNISQPANPTLLNDDFIDEAQLNAITDGDTTSQNNIEFLSSRDIVINSEISDANMEILLLRIKINYTPLYDFATIKLRGLAINGNNVTDSLHTYPVHIDYFPVFSEDVAHHTENSFSDQVGGLSDSYWNYDPNLTDGTVPENDKWNNIINFTNAGNTNPNPTNPNADLHFEVTRTQSGNPPFSWKDADLLLLTTGSTGQSLIIDFRTLFWFDIAAGDILANGDSYQTFNFSLTGNLNDISLLRGASILKPLSYDFYANVNGRVNTDNAALGQSNNPNLGNLALLENPIDIIYDLVRSELGHAAINEAEYLEARAAHINWKFGFTQSKKIHSKQLIQEIAKSTKCFPKFKNDGTFGFNTIKTNYRASLSSSTSNDNDYEKATLIKESEVISYSFKKTKPEQIYQQVDVQYKKDYAQDSYLKRTDMIDHSAPDYYEISALNRRKLEFESDYIRYDDTANYLRNYLAAQYKNDHLIINLKLPLQYINLEIGDKIKFRELLGGGIKAYGIDYRKLDSVGNIVQQYYYPLFIITSTTKNLDSISIECMQLHHLSALSEVDEAWQDNGVGGQFYFGESTLTDDSDQVEETVAEEPVGGWENPLAVSEGVLLIGDNSEFSLIGGYNLISSYIREFKFHNAYASGSGWADYIDLFYNELGTSIVDDYNNPDEYLTNFNAFFGLSAMGLTSYNDLLPPSNSDGSYGLGTSLTSGQKFRDFVALEIMFEPPGSTYQTGGRVVAKLQNVYNTVWDTLDNYMPTANFDYNQTVFFDFAGNPISGSDAEYRGWFSSFQIQDYIPGTPYGGGGTTGSWHQNDTCDEIRLGWVLYECDVNGTPNDITAGVAPSWFFPRTIEVHFVGQDPDVDGYTDGYNITVDINPTEGIANHPANVRVQSAFGVNQGHNIKISLWTGYTRHSGWGSLPPTSFGAYNLKYEFPSSDISFPIALLGDANLDGGIDILDIVTMSNMILSYGEGSSPQAMANADIDQNTGIDVLDIVQIVNTIMDN